MRHRLAVIALAVFALGMTACDAAASSDAPPMAQVMAEPRPMALAQPVLLPGYASLVLLPGDAVSVYFDVARAVDDARTLSGLTASAGDARVAVRDIVAINDRELSGIVVTRYRGTISYDDCPKGTSTLTRGALSLSDGDRVKAPLGTWCIERRTGKYADSDLYVKNAVSLSARAFRAYTIGVSKRDGALGKADADALSLRAAGLPDGATGRELGADNVLTLTIEGWDWDVGASTPVTIRPLLLYDSKSAQLALSVGDSAVFGAPVSDVEAVRAAVGE